MSSVQSIRRAFDVLSTLGDGPLGVTEVADRAGLPKSTAARLLATLVGEGAVEQVPGDTSYRLGPRLITLAGGFSLARSLAAIARPMLIDLAEASGEAAGLGDAGRRPRPLHRPGGHRAPGAGARLDRRAGAAARRVVGAGPAGVPDAGGDRALPRAADGALHRADAGRRRCRPRAPARDPAAGLHLGDRGVRRRDLVGRGSDRRRIGRGDRGGPCPRTVVPIPDAGIAMRTWRSCVLAGAARIAAGLRET